MTEQEARAIADAFVARELGRLPPCDGAHYLGPPEPRWTFFYKIETQPGEVIDPSHLHVVVDATTKIASFFMVM